MNAKMTSSKLKWAILASTTALFLISISCASESEDQMPTPNPDRCEDNNATLSGDVMPIIQQNCAVSGCHVAGTGRVDFTVKENIIQNASLIRTNTQAGIMPPPDSGRTITATQKELIFCWVTNGAEDN